MLLPIGHETGSVRRLPWVTFGIMAICVAAHILATAPTDNQIDAIQEKVREVADFYMTHPHLQLSPQAEELLFADAREDYRDTLLEVYRSEFDPIRDPQERAAAQATLDALVAEAWSAADSLPWRRWGLVPASPSAITFITHMFLHGGWLHLLGNLFILYLAGPFVEDVWGRGLYAAFYVAGGLAAAVLFLLHTPSTTVPMIGASGAIAAVMGAFLVRYWNTRIHFLYVFGFVFHGTFSAPAFTMLPLWFGEQLFMAMLTDSETSGVAYWAHVGGFAFGVAGAFAVRHTRAEERWIRPSIDARVNPTLVDNSVLDAALEARAAGDREAALTLLAQAGAREPDNREVNLAWWSVAAEVQRAAEATPALVRVIRDELRAGEVGAALEHWRQLTGVIADPAVDAALLLRLARALAVDGDSRGAAAALRLALLDRRGQMTAGLALLLRLARALAVDGDSRGAAAALRLALLDRRGQMTAGLALRIGREARPIDADLARGAARLTLACPDINAAERSGAEALLAELDRPSPAPVA